jgi:hypothetical protein
MKGVVFNLLEQVVTAEVGEEAWDDILDAAGSSGAYTAVGTYELDDFMSLVGAAAAKVGKPENETVQWFGRKALPLLAQLYPAFFEPHTSTRPFLLTLNDVIHPEVRKLFPGAYAPEFEFIEEDGEHLALGYISYRNLCAFAEGLIEGAADHYGETVEISQSSCTRRGDDKCVLVCSFS